MKTTFFTLLSMIVLLLCVAVSAATATAADPEKVILPDGKFFPFWDDQTVYRKTYHVTGRNPRASDANPGTEEKPLKTIGRAVRYPGTRAASQTTFGHLAERFWPGQAVGGSADAGGVRPGEERVPVFVREGPRDPRACRAVGRRYAGAFSRTIPSGRMAVATRWETDGAVPA